VTRPTGSALTERLKRGYDRNRAQQRVRLTWGVGCLSAPATRAAIFPPEDVLEDLYRRLDGTACRGAFAYLRAGLAEDRSGARVPQPRWR